MFAAVWERERVKKSKGEQESKSMPTRDCQDRSTDRFRAPALRLGDKPQNALKLQLRPASPYSPLLWSAGIHRLEHTGYYESHLHVQLRRCAIGVMGVFVYVWGGGYPPHFVEMPEGLVNAPYAFSEGSSPQIVPVQVTR